MKRIERVEVYLLALVFMLVMALVGAGVLFAAVSVIGRRPERVTGVPSVDAGVWPDAWVEQVEGEK